MKLLFENFRKFLNEVGDPDNPDDNSPSTQEMARELEEREIAKVVDDFGFNPGWKEQKDLIHWEVGAPIIEYEYRDDGTYDYKATIPNDSENWKELPSEQGEGIFDFLTRVREYSRQLSLPLQTDPKKEFRDRIHRLGSGQGRSPYADEDYTRAMANYKEDI